MALYDHFASTFSKSRQDHPWPELDYIISDIREQGYTSMLDVGCGNGRFLEQMERGDWSVERYRGVDNSTGMIEEARKLHPEYSFTVCDMLSFSAIIPTDQPTNPLFDAIVFLASFHHLETPEERIQVLHDVKKLIAPGGRVYMTNWNLREQPKYEKSHRWNGDYDIKIGAHSRYYHGFTTGELSDLFIESGYEIVENRIWETGKNIVTVVEKII
jgi:tRNA (uracil-5-)-methyltransferase TRM9